MTQPFYEIKIRVLTKCIANFRHRVKQWLNGYRLVEIYLQMISLFYLGKHNKKFICGIPFTNRSHLSTEFNVYLKEFL